MIEHLHVIKEGHPHVKWEPKPKLTPRHEILERLCTLTESQNQCQSDNDCNKPPIPRHRLSSRLKKDPTPDPSPSPPTEQRYLQRLANLANNQPKVVAPPLTTTTCFGKPTTIESLQKPLVQNN